VSAQNDASLLRMFILILGALVLFTVIIVIAANYVGGNGERTAANDAMRDAAVAERIKPVGQVATGAATTAEPVVVAAREPAKVYQTVCFACHGTGAAGAPKVGDKAAWGPRFDQGLDTLLTHATNGKGAMPPRGGNPTVTDEELRGTIIHMLRETGYDAN